MTDRGSEFSILQGIHVRFEIKIDISETWWQAVASIGFDSNDTNQAGAGDFITSRSRDKLKALYLYYQSAYGYQTW